MTRIEINKKMYAPAELTFNNVCALERMGVSLLDAKERSMSLMRGYLALCMNTDADVAGAELESHVMNGGGIDGLAKAMTEAIDESGFFRALRERPEEKTAAVEAEA